MRRFSLLPLLLVLLAGCDSLRLGGEATLAGLVIDDRTSLPVAGALVAVEGTSQTTTTGTDGRYALVVEADSTGDVFTVTASADGYATASADVRADVGDEASAPVLRLQPFAPEVPGGVPGGASGPANSITLAQRTAETVGVSGAGAVETVTLTFVVYDGSGRPVSSANAVDLSFSIVSGPGGGETLVPAAARTGADGRAQTTLTSGTAAGTVQVLATGTVGGRTVRSLPVTVVITGGLPNGAQFSVASERLNIPGYDLFGVTTPVTAFVGDRYGNPVQPGTAVYFTTDGGLIGGSGSTGADGRATVTLLTAQPLPANAPPAACPDSDPRGYARLRARTSDAANQPLEATTTVLFSGETLVSDLQPGGLALGAYTFRVADRFGHPLAAGTRIAVTADGVNVKSVGDASFALGDYLCPGPGRTEFTFAVSAGDGDEAPVLRSIAIAVTSPNGDARLTRASGGRLAAGDRFERR